MRQTVLGVAVILCACVARGQGKEHIKEAVRFNVPKIASERFVLGENCKVLKGNLVLTRGLIWQEDELPDCKAIYSRYFDSIASVVLKVGITAPNNEMGFSVGSINGVLNHDDGQNYFRNGDKPAPSAGKASFELHRAVRTPAALVPGRFHVIELKQDADRVIVRIDGVKHYGVKAQLQGTICLYPRIGTMVLRELTVDGVVDAGKKVKSPSHNNLY